MPRRLLAALRIGELRFVHQVGQEFPVVEVPHDGAAFHQLREPGREQSVQGLPYVELRHAGGLDDGVDVVLPVQQSHDPSLLFGEGHVTGGQASPIHAEHHVKGGDLLLDQAPFIHPTRPFEQERLGIDRDHEILRVGLDVALERERPAAPGEEEVHGFLDLHLGESLQLRALEPAGFHQHVAQAFAPGRALVHGLRQFFARDPAALDQQVAQPVTTIRDRGVGDAARVEVDLSLEGAVREREPARLLPQREKLEDVGQRGFFELTLNRYHVMLRTGTA
jgi:hypothetical protein